jgi:hypothetical protein
MGFLGPGLARRRAGRRFVRTDAESITVRRSRFVGFTLPWTDVASVECEVGRIRFGLKGGGERTVRTIVNRDEVAAAVARGAARAGVLVEGARVPDATLPDAVRVDG